MKRHERAQIEAFLRREYAPNHEAKSHSHSPSPHISAVNVNDTAPFPIAKSFSASGESPPQSEELPEVRQQAVLPISRSDVHPAAQDGQPVEG